MKKSVKILGTLTASAIAALAVTSCTKKTDNGETKSNESTQPVETKPVESKPSESTGTNSGSDSSTPAESTTTPAETTTPADNYSISLNTDNVTKTFIKGQTFTFEGLVVTDSLGETIDLENVIVNYSAVNTEEVGKYTVTVGVRKDGKVYTASYEVEVVNEIVKEISTAAELLEMSAYNDEETKVNPYSYKLTADIDLSGVNIPAAVANFTGTFDGNGYSIKNATYSTTGSKEGMLFKTISGNATVKNVRFFNCTSTSEAESNALIAGEVYDAQANNSNITLSNIEFSLCTVKSSNNYSALAISRVEKASNVTINLESITVKSLTSVTCSQYGGGILGDILADTTVNAKNCDIDLTTTTSANGSQLVGRNRGGNISAENIIFRGSFGQSSNSCGYVCGGNATSAKISVKNILVLGTSNCTGDLLRGNSKGTSYTVENVKYVTLGTSTDNQGTVEAPVAKYAQIEKSAVTSDWCLSSEGLGLDSTIWESDAAKTIKIKTSSSNVKSEGATVLSVSAITTNAKVEYFTADSFSLDGIALTTVYSDGVVLVGSFDSSADTYKIINSENQEVTLTDSKFTSIPVGDYTVELNIGGKTCSYTIQVVEYTNCVVETGDTSLIYVAGNKLDLSSVYVYNTKSNGTKEYVAIGNATVAIESPSSAIIKNGDTLSEVGTYTVTITANGKVATAYTFDVVASTQANEGLVKVVVDSAQAESQKLNTITTTDQTAQFTSYYSFNTIEKAVNYLTNLGLDNDASKIIEVKNGTYREKVTISIPNVSIVGESELGTILDWDTAEGSTKLSGSGTYAMECATLTVKDTAVGFTLSNMTVKNSFDYQNSKLADKQAFAFQSDADKTTVKSVTFSSVQDTLYANAGRQYYYHCTIKGAVDYVFGQKDVTAYFDSCEFHTVARLNADGSAQTNTGYVFAPKSTVGETGLTYNYVVVNSSFTADDNVPEASISVARPWGANAGVAVLNSSFTKHYSTQAYTGSGKPRYDAMSGQSPVNAHFYEYNNSGEGSISEAVAGVTMLTDAEAQNYLDASKVLAAQNGAITYAGGEFNFSSNTVAKTFVDYTLGKSNYVIANNDTFVASTIYAYELSYDSYSGTVSTYKAITPSEKFYNSENQEVTADVMVKTAGTYTAKLIYNDQVLATKEIVVAADVSKVTTSILASDLDETKISTSITSSYGQEFSFDGISIKLCGKVTASSDGSTSEVGLKLTNANEITYENVKYKDAIQNGGGGAKAVSGKASNMIGFTITKKSKVTFLVTDKKSGGAAKSYNIYKADDLATSIYNQKTTATDTYTTPTLVTCELEAGTYYFGAESNGCLVYAITCTYEA